MDSETYRRLIKGSKLLEEENRNRNKIIVIDEIQKQAHLLDDLKLQKKEKKNLSFPMEEYGQKNRSGKLSINSLFKKILETYQKKLKL